MKFLVRTGLVFVKLVDHHGHYNDTVGHRSLASKLVQRSGVLFGADSSVFSVSTYVTLSVKSR